MQAQSATRMPARHESLLHRNRRGQSRERETKRAARRKSARTQPRSGEEDRVDADQRTGAIWASGAESAPPRCARAL
eukprot:6196851-Pleurochrysis_carterae.AAC.2